MQLLCFYTGAFVLAFGPRVAMATSTAESSTQAAKELVRQGTAEYTKQHWEAARVAFLKAWEIKQHYAIAANLGEVELKLGRYREAAQHLKYALANLPPEHAEKRADAEASLKESRAHLSAVHVSVSVPGAVVKIDGQAVPEDALSDELLLDPGAHTLEGEKPGYLISSREFLATDGESREIRLELLPQPPPDDTRELHATRTSPSQPPDQAHSSKPVWILVGGGAATVVAAGLGTYYSLHASSLSSDSRKFSAEIDQQSSASTSSCLPGSPMRPAACDQLNQAESQRVSAKNGATASWVAAGAIGVATVVTYLVWPTKENEPTAKNARFVVAPWLGEARGGTVQLSF